MQLLFSRSSSYLKSWLGFEFFFDAVSSCPRVSISHAISESDSAVWPCQKVFMLIHGPQRPSTFRLTDKLECILGFDSFRFAQCEEFSLGHVSAERSAPVLHNFMITCAVLS